MQESDHSNLKRTHADTKKGGGGALLDGQQSDPEERALDEDGKPLMKPRCIRKSNRGLAPTDRRSEPQCNADSVNNAKPLSHGVEKAQCAMRNVQSMCNASAEAKAQRAMCKAFKSALCKAMCDNSAQNADPALHATYQKCKSKR